MSLLLSHLAGSLTFKSELAFASIVVLCCVAFWLARAFDEFKRTKDKSANDTAVKTEADSPAAVEHKRDHDHDHDHGRDRDRRPDFDAGFIYKPVVLLGEQTQESGESVEMWHPHPAFEDHRWSLEFRHVGEDKWRRPVISRTPISLPKVPVLKADTAEEAKAIRMSPAMQYRAVCAPLKAGAEFEYRVHIDGNVAFHAKARARNSVDQPFRVAVPGDLGYADESSTERVAYQIGEINANLMVIQGDIVYFRGRISEYSVNFFPVYNSDVADPKKGAPILRSVITTVVPGNHDMALPDVEDADSRDFSIRPDLLGYFQFWSQPLNGPTVQELGTNFPQIHGDPARQHEFQVTAGERYPRMTMGSFDWGNAHFLSLDTNAYMDWTDATLRNWVERHLTAARSKATWLIVCLHHTPFTSDTSHESEQRARLLCPIFEKTGVDLVISGHVHSYERTRPMRFKPDALTTALNSEDCPVPGTFEFDTVYDGVTQTRPNGVIYWVNGAAGAHFSKKGPPATLQPYTVKFDSSIHSFGDLYFEGRKLTARQVDENGQEIDRFVIEK